MAELTNIAEEHSPAKGEGLGEGGGRETAVNLVIGSGGWEGPEPPPEPRGPPPPDTPPSPQPPPPPDQQTYTPKYGFTCKDFLKGTCKRPICKFKHEITSKAVLKEFISFCHDYQNKNCPRPSCKFIHCTTTEETNFHKTSILPQAIVEKYNLQNVIPVCLPPLTKGTIICRHFAVGRCKQGAECKYSHEKGDATKDKQQRQQQQPQLQPQPPVIWQQMPPPPPPLPQAPLPRGPPPPPPQQPPSPQGPPPPPQEHTSPQHNNIQMPQQFPMGNPPMMEMYYPDAQFSIPPPRIPPLRMPQDAQQQQQPGYYTSTPEENHLNMGVQPLNPVSNMEEEMVYERRMSLRQEESSPPSQYHTPLGTSASHVGVKREIPQHQVPITTHSSTMALPHWPDNMTTLEGKFVKQEMKPSQAAFPGTPSRLNGESGQYQITPYQCNGNLGAFSGSSGCGGGMSVYAEPIKDEPDAKRQRFSTNNSLDDSKPSTYVSRCLNCERLEESNKALEKSFNLTLKQISEYQCQIQVLKATNEFLFDQTAMLKGFKKQQSTSELSPLMQTTQTNRASIGNALQPSLQSLDPGLAAPMQISQPLSGLSDQAQIYSNASQSARIQQLTTQLAQAQAQSPQAQQLALAQHNLNTQNIGPQHGLGLSAQTLLNSQQVLGGQQQLMAPNTQQALQQSLNNQQLMQVNQNQQQLTNQHLALLLNQQQQHLRIDDSLFNNASQQMLVQQNVQQLAQQQQNAQQQLAQQQQQNCQQQQQQQHVQQQQQQQHVQQQNAQQQNVLQQQQNVLQNSNSTSSLVISSSQPQQQSIMTFPANRLPNNF